MANSRFGVNIKLNIPYMSLQSSYNIGKLKVAYHIILSKLIKYYIKNILFMFFK